MKHFHVADISLYLCIFPEQCLRVLFDLISLSSSRLKLHGKAQNITKCRFLSFCSSQTFATVLYIRLPFSTKIQRFISQGYKFQLYFFVFCHAIKWKTQKIVLEIIINIIYVFQCLEILQQEHLHVLKKLDYKAWLNFLEKLQSQLSYCRENILGKLSIFHFSPHNLEIAV